MSKYRQETVGSYVRSRDYISFDVKYDEHEKVGQVAHWVCSCGSKGTWWISTKQEGYKFKLLERWQEHCSRKHPDIYV